MSSPPRMRLRARILAIAFALGAAGSIAGPIACGRVEGSEVLPSIKLGMAPRDIRDRFEPSAQGSWQTKIGSAPGDDTVLEWVARDPSSSRVTTAKFEFHLGMLVAVRAHLREGTPAESIEVTPKTVTSRAPAASGGSDLTILARDCPTHREEAEAVASRSKPRS
ncbi:MAG: hypothetical protein JST00_01565 [Deltaproteobacteria bacterium]|nr:hypothetical protein [Deltaproteobacteria bacterium]